MRARVWLGVLLVVLAGGCAHLKKDQAVCPEYRDLRCMAGERCSMDRSRGCKVCECEEMSSDPSRTGVGPDQNALPPPTEPP